MVTLLVALAVLGILFGAAALATYEGDVLREPHPDDRPSVLPSTALQPEDVAEVRFDMALRGYRMSEVDAVLQRVADELADRDARIADLEHALSEPAEPIPSPAELPLPDPEPVAPAVIAGPLTATTWWTDQPPARERVAAEELVASAPVDTVDIPVEQASEAPAEEPVASVPVDSVDVPVEQTSAVPAEAPAEEPVASAPMDTEDVPVEQTSAAEPSYQDEEPAALDVPASLPEPPALTLPAADEAFSFPELHPPEAAVEEPEQFPDWWTSLPEPPSSEGDGRG